MVVKYWVQLAAFVGVVACVALCVLSVDAFRSVTRAQTSGVTVERVAASIAPSVDDGSGGVIGNGVITLVRVDLARYRLRILTEARHGARRPIPRWVREHHLGGAINAGMFLPSGRSVGFMKQDGEVVSDRHVSRYHGVIGFEPLRRGAPLRVGGRGCSQALPRLRARYGNVLQALRMVDCRGRAVRWPNRKRYSAAGLGVDREGRAVFMHTRTPYRMTQLNQMLADDALGIRGMIYMEGGPEASLVVSAEGHSVREVGSYEDGFNENDDNMAFWDVPNVIAFEPR